MDKERLTDASDAIKFAEQARAYAYRGTRLGLDGHLTLLRGFMEDNTFEVGMEGPGTLNQLKFTLPLKEFKGTFQHLPIHEIRKIIAAEKEVTISVYRTDVQVTSDTGYSFMVLIGDEDIRLTVPGRLGGRTLLAEDHWTKRAKAVVEFLGWIGDVLESKRIKPEAETTDAAAVTP